MDKESGNAVLGSYMISQSQEVPEDHPVVVW